ncbi:MAG: VOC family protein [Rhodobiaceae bacterium]|nr:VOC family protein [Rhodobiaceae bacterium]
MKLAKPRFDIGLATNNLESMRDFWQKDVGVPLDHVLKVKRGQNQHRHDVMGSVLKINHFEETVPDAPPAGYLELLVASDKQPQSLVDPDGNAVSLVRPGVDGISQIAVRVGVRDLAAHKRFYSEAFGFPERPYDKGLAFQAGEGLILLEEDPSAPSDAEFRGKGWRYITFQVFKVDDEHKRVLDAGGREALAPVTLGKTARISMVRDPDGNWIELSQRASIVGSLD